MNGAKARIIRNQVYGDHSPRYRDYTFNGGTLNAGVARRAYQRLKANEKS